MRSKRVWRYYCDFCRKSGCNSGHIRNHEKRCVRNPSRECRMCEHATGEEGLGPHASLDALVRGIERADVEGLREVAQGCPACMLAGVLEWKRRAELEGLGPEDLWIDFDFKKESELMWREKDEGEREFRRQRDEETLAGIAEHGWAF